MNLSSLFRRFIDELGKSGLILRGDPPKVLDLEGREWGDAVSGLMLSVATRGALLSVVLRNTMDQPRSFMVPGWLHFFEINIIAPDSMPVPLTAFGRATLQQGRATALTEVRIEPGQAIEIDLPIEVLFAMHAPGRYTARVRCPELQIESNVCVVMK